MAVRPGLVTRTAEMVARPLASLVAKEGTAVLPKLETLEMLTVEASATPGGASSTNPARQTAGTADTAKVAMLSVGTVVMLEKSS
ncbi:hypothetical protein BDY19DRAFT_941690 [Irpex rosettiformis]|uniref:Uncharacterized protein n=1 Tax=Irpex rosettiformis TaxID=378272 RepID=A0ACB8U6P0_9APHY|nr:hypothetical protein BDY19DRAFT_941690 [Irpex rosettiformis]